MLILLGKRCSSLTSPLISELLATICRKEEEKRFVEVRSCFLTLLILIKLLSLHKNIHIYSNQISLLRGWSACFQGMNVVKMATNMNHAERRSRILHQLFPPVRSDNLHVADCFPSLQSTIGSTCRSYKLGESWKGFISSPSNCHCLAARRLDIRPQLQMSRALARISR